MRQNEPNIYIGEKKIRSFGGYGQRSRSARAATGCGPRVHTRPHTAPLHRAPHSGYWKPRARTHDRDADTYQSFRIPNSNLAADRRSGKDPARSCGGRQGTRRGILRGEKTLRWTLQSPLAC
ncbi:uncharacterized protein LOC131851780 [Achroia grisella]|uniref:uncharacterized protein LOC131851780 n=1 Tax=Achroia grisella TaxID=688607 RepID=UPI0027D31C0D|nr:uncharacterized protein LOC131851780 [Achroia grisella]